MTEADLFPKARSRSLATPTIEEKRREDACALLKLSRNITLPHHGLRTQCFGVRCDFASLLLCTDGTAT